MTARRTCHWYQQVSVRAFIAKSANDARRIAEALRVSFPGRGIYDADYRTLSRRCAPLVIARRDADAAVIFYAGHGVQVEHDNYLLPADAKLEREHDLVYEALSPILPRRSVASQAVGILLLDACRNNPSSTGCRRL